MRSVRAFLSVVVAIAAPAVALVPPAGSPQAAVIQELRSWKAVKDVLYQPGQAVEWQVGVLSNGSERYGYASSVCDELKKRKLARAATVVRIVDIVKVMRNGDFRAASLGSVRCQDYSKAMP